MQNEVSGGAAAEPQPVPETDAVETGTPEQTGAESAPVPETDASNTGADEAVRPTEVTSGAGASRVGEP